MKLLLIAVSLVFSSTVFAAQGSLILIFDTSGSMDDRVGSSGKSKIEIAKDVLNNDFIPLIDQEFQIGLQVFSCFGQDAQNVALGHATQIIRENPHFTQREWIMEQIDKATAQGSTPLVATLQRSKEQLLASDHSPGKTERKIVVLITDGEADEGAIELKKEIKKSVAQKIDVFGIGFSIDSGGVALKESLGDHYFEATADRASLQKAMSSILSEIEK